MRLFLPLLICILVFNRIQAQQNIKTLTDDGAWCWFSDPRAILTSNKQVITGWVKKDGTIEVAQLNPQDHTVETRVLFEKMEIDDHNNPAFVELPDQRIITMYTWHGSKNGIVSQKTKLPNDIHSFSEPSIIRPGIETLLSQFPRETYTYANPFYLENEETIYAFGRWIGYKPNMIRSEDGGKTWKDARVIISTTPFDSNNRPYVKYASDGQSKIHLVFTNGHPAVEPLNGIYHCFYENGAFWRSDGSKICSEEELPFQPEDATLVYKADSISGRAWLADIAIDQKGNPYIAYTRHPQSTDHRYHYARFNPKKKVWTDHEICQAGGWFPQTIPGTVERELYYHGNMTFHPDNPQTIYLSRQINDRFEIEKRTTSNKGRAWKITPITQNSIYDQVRPYVPRNIDTLSKPVLLWMENRKYIHYTDFDTRIKYWIDEKG